MGMALDYKADGPGVKFLLLPDKTYLLCSVAKNVHIKITSSVIVLSIYVYE